MLIKNWNILLEWSYQIRKGNTKKGNAEGIKISQVVNFHHSSQARSAYINQFMFKNLWLFWCEIMEWDVRKTSILMSAYYIEYIQWYLKLLRFFHLDTSSRPYSDWTLVVDSKYTNQTHLANMVDSVSCKPISKKERSFCLFQWYVHLCDWLVIRIKIVSRHKSI